MWGFSWILLFFLAFVGIKRASQLASAIKLGLRHRIRYDETKWVHDEEQVVLVFDVDEVLMHLDVKQLNPLAPDFLKWVSKSRRIRPRSFVYTNGFLTATKLTDATEGLRRVENRSFDELDIMKHLDPNYLERSSSLVYNIYPKINYMKDLMRVRSYLQYIGKGKGLDKAAIILLDDDPNYYSYNMCYMQYFVHGIFVISVDPFFGGPIPQSDDSTDRYAWTYLNAGSSGLPTFQVVEERLRKVFAEVPPAAEAVPQLIRHLFQAFPMRPPFSCLYDPFDSYPFYAVLAIPLEHIGPMGRQLDVGRLLDAFFDDVEQTALLKEFHLIRITCVSPEQLAALEQWYDRRKANLTSRGVPPIAPYVYIGPERVMRIRFLGSQRLPYAQTLHYVLNDHLPDVPAEYRADKLPYMCSIVAFEAHHAVHAPGEVPAKSYQVNPLTTDSFRETFATVSSQVSQVNQYVRQHGKRFFSSPSRRRLLMAKAMNMMPESVDHVCLPVITSETD